MAKDAQYYREYRARRKDASLATQGVRPLFALVGNDKEASEQASKAKAARREEAKRQRRPRTEKLDAASVAVDHRPRHQEEKIMGDVLDFRSRAMIEAAIEEQKEAIICEVLAEVSATIEQEKVEASPRAVAPKLVAQPEPETKEVATAVAVAEIAKWLRNHGMLVAIATFLVCNTALLVFWQYSFYLASGYSVLVAVATATVMEVALVLQSCLFGATRGLAKVALGGTTVATLLVVAQLLHSGVATRTGAGVAKQVEVEAINKRIDALASLEANAIASIEAMDTKTYPTKIEAARNALNAPGGYSHQIAELRKELAAAKQAGSSVAKGQGDALAHQQWLLLVLNIVLAHVLGLGIRDPQRFISEMSHFARFS